MITIETDTPKWAKIIREKMDDQSLYGERYAIDQLKAWITIDCSPDLEDMDPVDICDTQEDFDQVLQHLRYSCPPRFAYYLFEQKQKIKDMLDKKMVNHFSHWANVLLGNDVDSCILGELIDSYINESIKQEFHRPGMGLAYFVDCVKSLLSEIEDCKDKEESPEKTVDTESL